MEASVMEAYVVLQTSLQEQIQDQIQEQKNFDAQSSRTSLV